MMVVCYFSAPRYLKVFQIINNSLPDVHVYANDTQLYLGFSPGGTGQAQAIEAMERCVEEIRTWMLTDKLRLNGNKTEFFVIGTKQCYEKLYCVTSETF